MKKRTGQSMVEYLVIISIISVATIGIVKLVSQSIRAKFAQVTYAIQGKKINDIRTIEFEDLKQRQVGIVGTEDFYEVLE